MFKSINSKFSAHASAVDICWYDLEEIDALLAMLWATLHEEDPARAESFLVFRTTPLDRLCSSLVNDSGLVTLRGMRDLELFYPNPMHHPDNQKPWEAYDHLIFPISVAKDIRLDGTQPVAHRNYYILCVLSKNRSLGDGYYSICQLHLNYLQPDSPLPLLLNKDICEMFFGFLGRRGYCGLTSDEWAFTRQRKNANDCGAALVRNVGYLFYGWLDSGQPPTWWPFLFIDRWDSEEALQEKLPAVYAKLLAERQRRAGCVDVRQQPLLEGQQAVPATRLLRTRSKSLSGLEDRLRKDPLDASMLGCNLRSDRLEYLRKKGDTLKLEDIESDYEEILWVGYQVRPDREYIRSSADDLSRVSSMLPVYINKRRYFLFELNEFHQYKRQNLNGLMEKRQNLNVLMLRSDPIQGRLEYLQQKAILKLEDIRYDYDQITLMGHRIAKPQALDNMLAQHDIPFDDLSKYNVIRRKFLDTLIKYYEKKKLDWL